MSKRIRAFMGILFLTNCTQISATTYTISSGNWSSVAPDFINGGDSVIITGNVSTTDQIVSFGTILIKNTGTLTLSNVLYTKPNQLGNIIVLGTLNIKNQSNLGGFGKLDIYGQCNNFDFMIINYPVVVESGGSLVNKNLMWMDSTLTIVSGGQLSNLGTLEGNATFNGSISNSGILSPGHSPGSYTINGDYTATSIASHNFEVGGVTTGTYDVLQASGNVNLNGSLIVSNYGSFTPSGSFSIPIVTGSIHGTFSSVSLPTGYSLSYTTNSVNLAFGGGVLPVLFINADVVKDGETAKINWTVGVEENVSHYEVEKSLDGSSFHLIGSIPASGNTKYFFKDNSPSSNCYYRIKEVDKDGKYAYSRILQLKNGIPTSVFQIFPVPAHNQIIVRHEAAVEHSNFAIYTLNGKRIEYFEIPKGEVETSISLSSFSSGVYILTYSAGGIELKREKLIKY